MRLPWVLTALNVLLPTLAQLKPPPLAQEIYSHNPLWRFNYTAVWNDTFPFYTDARQVKVNDCWLPASSAAVTWVNADWISRLFYFPDGFPMRGHYYPASEWAILQLWNPTWGQKQNFTVNVFNKSLTEDKPGGNWWHSAITQGFQQMAGVTDIYGIHPNGTLKDHGIPAVAMAMLTGKKVNVTEVWQYKSQDEWWAHMQHAPKSPIVITTISISDIKPVVPEIHGNHAYAVLTTKQEGGNRTMLLRNPWGSQDWYKAEDVYKNVYYMNYIDGFPELIWDG